MKNRFLSTALLSAMLIGFVGCGGDSMPATTVVPPGPVNMIKQSLEQFVASGQLDSSIVTVKEQIEEIRKADAAKADALAKDLADLEAAKGADKVKAKAKEILGKL